QGYRDARGVLERLIHDTVALREPEQGIELLRARVGVQVEPQAYRLKPHRYVLRDAQRAAKIQVAFGGDGPAVERQGERRGDRLQRDPGAGNQGFEQQIARARRATVTAR